MEFDRSEIFPSYFIIRASPRQVNARVHLSSCLSIISSYRIADEDDWLQKSADSLEVVDALLTW